MDGQPPRPPNAVELAGQFSPQSTAGRRSSSATVTAPRWAGEFLRKVIPRPRDELHWGTRTEAMLQSDEAPPTSGRYNIARARNASNPGREPRWRAFVFHRSHVMAKRRGRPQEGCGKRMASGSFLQTIAAREARGHGDVRAVALSQPHRAWLGETRRDDHRAECEIRRLLLADHLTQVEGWAAERWRNIIREFHIVLATPMNTMSALTQMVTSSIDPDAWRSGESGSTELPETEEDKRDRVLARHGAAMSRLRRCGDAAAVFSEMERVVIHEACRQATSRL